MLEATATLLEPIVYSELIKGLYRAVYGTCACVHEMKADEDRVRADTS